MEQTHQRNGQTRPHNCVICYEVEIGLRRDKTWQGNLPTRKDHLLGKLAGSDFHKRELKRRKEEVYAEMSEFLHKGNNVSEEEEEYEERCRQVEEEWYAELKEKAQGILDQLTQNSIHRGQDSMLPSDIRFKRTAKGNLLIGAASITAVLKEAAWRMENNPGRKRFLSSRLWISPGKLPIYRFGAEGEREFLKKADGRYERTVPPESPSPANMFRGKRSTIIYAERVDYPACIHLWLWVDPAVTKEMLESWWPVAEERGIMGYRQMKEGQFDVLKFKEASDSALRQLLAREEAKMRGE